MTKHCCSDMETFLSEGKVAISYSLDFREYAIDLRTSSGKQLIQFCPWCGQRLPSPLRDEWFRELENMFDNFDGFGDPRIPEEFRSDAWWKERKL
jgi:hypothetical protein